MTVTSKHISRAAIDCLKSAHIDGVPFTISEAQSHLFTQGFQRRQLGKRHVGDWLRRARYELADSNVSVTSPVRHNGYTSNPNASPDGRIISRSPLVKDLGTRTTNILRLLGADSHQVDASPEEIERRTRLTIAAEILAKV